MDDQSAPTTVPLGYESRPDAAGRGEGWRFAAALAARAGIVLGAIEALHAAGRLREGTLVFRHEAGRPLVMELAAWAGGMATVLIGAAGLTLAAGGWGCLRYRPAHRRAFVLSAAGLALGRCALAIFDYGHYLGQYLAGGLPMLPAALSFAARLADYALGPAVAPAILWVVMTRPAVKRLFGPGE